MAHLGEAVARVDGKAHFVAGAMPGEVVLGEVVLDKGAWARVELSSITKPAPGRVEPPCRHFSTCGGCQWQFAGYETQLEWKTDIVAGQLRHLGRIDAPVVRPAVTAGDPYAYRNRMDFRVVAGKPALHRARSRELVRLDECLLLLPGLDRLFGRLGNLGNIRRITMRMSATTGQSLLIVDGPLPDSLDDVDGIIQRTSAGSRIVSGKGWIEEDIAGNRLRISGGSFFQSNTAAAALLVDLAKEGPRTPTRRDTARCVRRRWHLRHFARSNRRTRRSSRSVTDVGAGSASELRGCRHRRPPRRPRTGRDRGP